MVKKLISGILGKKEESAKAPPQDVPDELPPLAEDVVAKDALKQEQPAAPTPGASQKPSAPPPLPTAPQAPEPAAPVPAQQSQPAKDQDAPDELPPLDPGTIDKAHEVHEPGTLDDLENEDAGIPDAIKKAKLAKSKSISTPLPLPGQAPAPEPAHEEETPPSKTEEAPVPEIPSSSPDKLQQISQEIKRMKESYSAPERIRSGIEPGFFSNILEHVQSHDGNVENLLSGDLFSRMDKYWALKKNEIKKGSPIPAAKKLQEDLVGKLGELKEMESKWQVQKLALDEDLKFIHEREREIQGKVKELQLVSNELQLFKTVKPDEYFRLKNGVVIKNLHDLIDILEVLDDLTFEAHVTSTRNDFAEWVRSVFKDDNLANKISRARTKAEIIETIESIPLSSTHEMPSSINIVINPKKYFWLDDGKVIRNLYELSDALKEMDDDIFIKHVDAYKNDFARWVNDVFNNEHLTGKLQKARTREDMVKAVELFL